MRKLIDLFFRVTNRLFAFFMDYLGRLLRNTRRLDLTNTFRKRLLVVRQGGFGDLMFISAVIAELKRTHPYLAIDLMCHPQYQGAFHRTTSIDRLVDHRWPSVLQLFNYDYFVFLDGVVECDPDAERLNIYDLFASKYFGITLPPSARKPALVPDPHSIARLSERIPGLTEGRTRIGLQPFANSPVRTPSMDFWARTGVAILRKMPEAQLFLLAEEGRSAESQALAAAINAELPAPRALSAAGCTRDVTELTALVSMLDAIVAPDSSVTHLAAAFDVPALGIYGPFPSQLRTRDYRLTLSVDAKTDCAPCFTHGHWPCAEARKAGIINSPCFDKIPQAALEATVDELVPVVRRHARHAPAYVYKSMSPNATSETSKFAGLIVNALESALDDHLADANGIEVGCGGAPLLSHAIALDLPVPYTKCGNQPIHLKGDCRHLPWFADNALDYLYSSHLFEDFPEPENQQIFAEWLRVVRPGGILALLLPHQQRYLAACKRKGEAPNEHHSIPDFGPEYMLRLASNHGACTVGQLVEFWGDDPNEYNFLLLLRKEPAINESTKVS